MRIELEETVCVVIDFQEKLMPFIHNFEDMITRSGKLLLGLQKLGVPTLITQQYTKGLGATVPAIVDSLGEAFIPVEKMTFSCCGELEFMQNLLALNPANVIIIGIETHICVLQSALDFIGQGMNAIIVEDCTSSRNPRDREVAIERMRHEGAVVTTYESILMELLRTSASEKFKEISKIIK
ncbi:MAG: isochorismatase family protein [Chloroflexota bacterium]